MRFSKDRTYFFWNPQGFLDTVFVYIVAENGIVFSWDKKLYVATNKVASARFFNTPEEVPEYKPYMPKPSVSVSPTRKLTADEELAMRLAVEHRAQAASANYGYVPHPDTWVLGGD